MMERIILIFITISLLLKTTTSLSKPYLVVASDESKSFQQYDALDRGSIRTKREVISANVESNTKLNVKKNPDVNIAELKTDHSQLIIDWVGEGSNVVVSLSRDANINNESLSDIFISFDYGLTFKKQTNLFKLDGDKLAIIDYFYKNEKFPSRFIFVDKINKYFFVTFDYGRTVYPRKLEFTPSNIITHPTDAMVIIAHDTEDSTKKLWLSSDFGETWHILGYYVTGYHWSTDELNPKLYVQRGEPGGHSAVVAYTKLNSNHREIPEPVISDIEQFEVKEDFLFAVKKVHLVGSNSKEATLQLWISHKGGPFLKARFPNNFPHMQYYVPYVSEEQVLVCVAHDAAVSNLYVSAVPRSANHEVLFSLSLPRIFYYQPNTTYQDTWIDDVGDKAFADLHPVGGVRGVLIASQISFGYANKPHKKIGPEHLTTVISFDLGGQWQPIQAPKTDVNGYPITCRKGCSLHLSQQFARLYPNSQSETILSSKSAPGIILAIGTVGSSLKGKPSVYLSRDAGISWHHILQGNYIYVLADHGGLMVAVKNYKSELQSNYIYYSTDEGQTWLSHKFYNKPLKVYGLKTEPGENSTVVLLFGSKKSEHEWIVFKMEFGPVFDSSCKKSDYKIWIPSDPITSLPLCILGRKQKFERRIPHVNCINGFNYDRPVSVHSCPCARQDYECDFGFVLSDAVHSIALKKEKTAKNSSKTNETVEDEHAEWLDPKLKEQVCVRDTSDVITLRTHDNSQMFGSPVVPSRAQSFCKEGAFYNKTKGYRKIPGDTCEGGKNFLYDPEVTPCPLFEEQEFLLVSSRQAVLRYDLLSDEGGLQPLPLTGLTMLIAFDFDMNNNCLYWADIVPNKIMRECFNGEHGQEVIVKSGTERVEGLAFDWISQNLYIVDGAKTSIMIFPLKSLKNTHPSSKNMKTILKNPELDKPRGIALHPVQGIMFFTDWSDDNPKVAKSSLDGTNLKILFGRGTVGWPNGITVDYQSEKIYFVDAKMDFVASSDFNGQKFTKLIDSAQRPFAVAVHKNFVYWDDTNARQVLRTDKVQGGPIVPINNNTIKGLVDMKIYGQWSQKGSNACNDSSATNCSYICTGLPNGNFQCICPDHMIPANNSNTSCVCEDKSEPSPHTGMCEMPITSHCKTKDQFTCSNKVCIPKTWQCDGADDCGDNSDEADCGVMQCPPSTSWQCDDGQCVLVAWKCDHDRDCKDGSDEKNCSYPACEKDQFRCANGRCISKTWLCDFENDCKDGSDETAKLCNTTALPSVKCQRNQFGCADSEQCIPHSWKCDGDFDCRDKSDEVDCANVTCNDEKRFQCANNQCIVNFWRCDGASDCADGSDEVNCTEITTTNAPPTTTHATPPGINCSISTAFKCDNERCIPMSWRCDGSDDCLDRSDEADCNHITSSTTPPPTVPTMQICSPDQFKCSSNATGKHSVRCIWNSWLCDGMEDCIKGEDEKNCSKSDPCSAYSDVPKHDKSQYFRCLHSAGCLHLNAKCNGIKDCADGSDELGCGSIHANISCPSGFFSCDGGDCVNNSVVCDHNTDCLDLSDEMHCTYQQTHRLTITLRLVLNTSISIKWRVKELNASDSLEFLPSIIPQAAVGNPSAWLNASNWTSDLSYTFTKLNAATPYLIRVLVRKEGREKAEHTFNVLSVTTEQGVPSVVRSVIAQQVGKMVKVSWLPPLQPNGRIIHYVVHVEPPAPPQEVTVYGNSTNVTISLTAAHLSTNFSIYVTASTTVYDSAPSEVFSLAYLLLNCPEKLNIKNVKSTTATVEWESVPNAKRYLVSHTRPENDFISPRVSLRTTDTSITLATLSPGMKYTVYVSSESCIDCGNTASGPQCSVSFTTNGAPLSPVTRLSAHVTDPSQSSVVLDWQPPSSGDESWSYQVVWGSSRSDFIKDFTSDGSNSAVTNETHYWARELHACRKYLFAVMVSGPLGYGPAVQIQVMTGENPNTAPTLMDAIVTNLTLNMVWQPSCTKKKTKGSQDSQSMYLLVITETSRNKTSRFQLPGAVYKGYGPHGSNHYLSHTVQVEYGGHYSIVIHSISGSQLSASSHPPKEVHGPPIYGPRQLSFTQGDSSLFWRKPTSLPHSVLTSGYTYIVYLRSGSEVPCTNSDDPLVPWDTHVAPNPPYICPHLQPGEVYCVSVALKTHQGYLSQKSQAIRVEIPLGENLVVSSRSVVGLSVVVLLVVTLLIVVVLVLVMRHRRLSNSFIRFANTHYSHTRGTTSISADSHNLDDEDAPVIQGFSDDEPLVVA